jgi:low temperature requirement protein LtrA
VSINRNAKTESDKVFLTRFFIVLGITFVAGGITRTIQQNTGIEWLNGVVAIFGGLFLSLWGVPIFRRISNNRERGLKAWLLFLAGIFIILLGFSVIILGITQVWKALL